MSSPRLAAIVLGLAGCSQGAALDLPLLAPPVRAAAPAGFHTAGPGVAPGAVALAVPLSATDFRDRFFNPSGGPTNVLALLDSVDARIDELDRAAATSAPACVTQAPVAYTVSVLGEDVPFWAQCYRTVSGAGFLQFGQHDGVTYLFVSVGAARLAARVTPAAGAANDQVEVWYGVGYDNATSCPGGSTFDACSYGVAHLRATPASQAFEMAVAGVGLGYCGFQLRSDGASIFGEGSVDMGEACGDAATLCTSAADLTQPGTCDAIDVFELPALGRAAGAGAHAFAASTYPATPDVTLDGTATDSLGFGPAAPTPGVGDFDGA